MRTRFGLEIPTTLSELCRPERMALVVYDMQARYRRPNKQWLGGERTCSGRA